MNKVVNKYPHAANGARVKQYRLELPRNRRFQKAVASACHISRRHLIRIEQGESLPGSEVRDRLAEYFGCSPEEIQAFDEDEEGDLGLDLERVLRRIIKEELAARS